MATRWICDRLVLSAPRRRRSCWDLVLTRWSTSTGRRSSEARSSKELKSKALNLPCKLSRARCAAFTTSKRRAPRQTTPICSKMKYWSLGRFSWANRTTLKSSARRSSRNLKRKSCCSPRCSARTSLTSSRTSKTIKRLSRWSNPRRSHTYKFHSKLLRCGHLDPRNWGQMG